ncbi:MAG: hypothetical protein Q4F57_09865 [Weeksellaceae bacterium]|nr:hypothetical protein [Weeksellaceae bacterium]
MRMNLLHILSFYIIWAAVIVLLDAMIRNYVLAIYPYDLPWLHGILIGIGVGLQVLTFFIAQKASNFTGMATMVVLVLKMIVILIFLFLQKRNAQLTPIDWIYRIALYFAHTLAMVGTVIKWLSLQK